MSWLKFAPHFLLDLCDLHVDKPEEPYAKWNKPVTEENNCTTLHVLGILNDQIHKI